MAKLGTEPARFFVSKNKQYLVAVADFETSDQYGYEVGHKSKNWRPQQLAQVFSVASGEALLSQPADVTSLVYDEVSITKDAMFFIANQEPVFKILTSLPKMQAAV